GAEAAARRRHGGADRPLAVGRAGRGRPARLVREARDNPRLPRRRPAAARGLPAPRAVGAGRSARPRRHGHAPDRPRGGARCARRAQIVAGPDSLRNRGLIHAGDLRDSPDEAAFRERVRSWLADNLPAEPGPAWSRKLYDAGFAGLTWPEEYGGRGEPYSHQAIALEEFAQAGAPNHMNVIALGMAGPTIMVHGTEEQKRRYLPRMLSAEEVWCQGFSEPGAGSDLSAARTRAEPPP